MPHFQFMSDSKATNRLLDNLNLAIDEATLVRKIVSLSDQLRSIENNPAQAGEARLLQQEIDHLEDKLAVLHLMSESSDLVSRLPDS